MSIPVPQFIPPIVFLVVHMFAIYIYVSISALQVSPFVHFFLDSIYILLLDISLRKTIIPKDTCIPLFIAALFTIARTWKSPKCPSTKEWIKKMWYTYTTSLVAGEEGNDRGWDGWVAPPNQWTWGWQTPGHGEEQGSLACCSPWSCKESDINEWLNWSDGLYWVPLNFICWNFNLHSYSILIWGPLEGN